MRAHGAASEGSLAATSDRRINNGGRASISLPELPPHVLEALEAEGVTDLTAWRALGRRRFRLFGVTRRTVEQLDRAAREAGI